MNDQIWSVEINKHLYFETELVVAIIWWLPAAPIISAIWHFCHSHPAQPGGYCLFHRPFVFGRNARLPVLSPCKLLLLTSYLDALKILKFYKILCHIEFFNTCIKY